jgi:uncharacterized membrane protein YwzB
MTLGVVTMSLGAVTIAVAVSCFFLGYIAGAGERAMKP